MKLTVLRCEVVYYKQKSWQLQTDSIKFMAALKRVKMVKTIKKKKMFFCSWDRSNIQDACSTRILCFYKCSHELVTSNHTSVFGCDYTRACANKDDWITVVHTRIWLGWFTVKYKPGHFFMYKSVPVSPDNLLSTEQQQCSSKRCSQRGLWDFSQ